MIMVMATALKSLPSAAQCGKPKPTAKLTSKNEHICPMIRKRRYPIHNNTVC